MKKLLIALSVFIGLAAASPAQAQVPYYGRGVSGKALYYYLKAKRSTAWMSNLRRTDKGLYYYLKARKNTAWMSNLRRVNKGLYYYLKAQKSTAWMSNLKRAR